MGILDEKLICIDADLHSSEECIELGATLFQDHGYVRPGYKEAVIARERKYPTGLPGKKVNIAIPHTNSEFVSRPAIGVIIPRRPVKFMMMGSSDTVLECGIIFPLAIKNSEMQIGILRKMTKIIDNPELLMAIKQSASKQEIMKFLEILNQE